MALATVNIDEIIKVMSASSYVHVFVTPHRRCRAVLKEFTDGVDLAELGREFQSETVRGKKRKLISINTRL